MDLFIFWKSPTTLKRLSLLWYSSLHCRCIQTRTAHQVPTKHSRVRLFFDQLLIMPGTIALGFPLSVGRCDRQLEPSRRNLLEDVAPTNALNWKLYKIRQDSNNFSLIFVVVSKAFTVLSDPQKRAIFDQHGPDEGKSSGVNYDRANPTGHGFGGGMHGMNGFSEEISPEELFNMFFGGGQFGGCKSIDLAITSQSIPCWRYSISHYFLFSTI